MKKIFLSIGFLSALLLLGGAGCFSLGGNDSPTTNGTGGVFLSTDKGEVWSAITAVPKADGVGSIANTSVYRMVEDPQDPQALYLATRAHGMFFTYDGGKTWQRPGDPLGGNDFIYSIAIHPKDKCTIYVTNGARIYKSNDCNRSWTEVFRETRAEARIAAIAFQPQEPFQVFFAAKNGDIFASSDAGESWTVAQRLGREINEMRTDPLQPANIYVATKSGGLFVSTDTGTSWTQLNSMKDFSGALEFRRLFLHPTKANVLYWVSTYGILVSADGGATWTAMNLLNPPGSVNIYSFAINPQNDSELYFTAASKSTGRGIFYKSIDGGVSWTTEKLPSGQLPTSLHVHPVNDSWLYLGFTIPQTN